MLFALIPGLIAIALFVATLRLKPPPQGRATWLPPAPSARKA
jgi:hypothetical protein